MYVLAGEGGLKLSSSDFTNLLATWCDKYPIISIEDAMHEGDWDGWAILTAELGKKVQLVGDDLYVTNTKILKEGIAKGIANSILIKINQIGTLTETVCRHQNGQGAPLRCRALFVQCRQGPL